MEKLKNFTNFADFIARIESKSRRILSISNMGDAFSTLAGFGGMEGKDTDTETPSSISFHSTRGDYFEKTITWRIDNIADFLDLSKEELQHKAVTFTAGNCLKNGSLQKATWKYYFTKTDENKIGGYLSLLTGHSAKAWYSLKLSSGGEVIGSFSLKGQSDFNMSTGPAWGWTLLARKANLLELTRGTDALDVTLFLKVFSDSDFNPVLQDVSPSSPTKKEQCQCKLRGQLASDFKGLLQSGDGADLEIKVPNGKDAASFYTKKAHKLVLVTRSSVFAKMFTNKEMVEAKKGVVIIKDLSPKGLDVLLHYLYTGEVLKEWLQVPEEILNSSEKYDLGGLKLYCGKNLISAVSASNALGLYEVAKLHKLSAAQKAIAKFISRNTNAVLDEDDNAFEDFD